MPIFNESNAKILERLGRFRRVPYGCDREPLKPEFKTPSFALFFKNPPYDPDPQVIRNFCFDDDYGNTDHHFGHKRFLGTNQNRFRRVFKLEKSVANNDLEFFYPRKSDSYPNRIDFIPPKSNLEFDKKGGKYNEPYYLAPWLGIPIDLAAEGNVSVTVPVSNAWRKHNIEKGNNDILDPYWRSKLPNDKKVTLELYSPDKEISARWESNNQNSTNPHKLDFDFSHDSLDDNIAGNYQNQQYTNGLFSENVIITLTADNAVAPFSIENQGKPRKLYIIWKRQGKKDEIVGSISILPFPVYDHYIWFINVAEIPPDGSANNPNGLLRYMPLRPKVKPFIPLSLDLDANKSHLQLGTISRQELRNQFGINLVVLDQVSSSVTYWKSDDRTIVQNGVSTLTPTPTLWNNVIDGIQVHDDQLSATDNISTPNLFRARIQATFPLVMPQDQGPFIGMDNQIFDGTGGRSRIQVNASRNILPNDLAPESPVNLQPVYSNLSLIFICSKYNDDNDNRFNGFPPNPDGTITLGQGFVPGGSNPFPDRSDMNNYFVGGDTNQAFPQIGFAFPGQVFLYDSELGDLNRFSGVTKPIVAADVDGGVSCHRESTLTHELLHNFGLSHIFSDGFTTPENRIPKPRGHAEFTADQLEANLNYWHGNRIVPLHTANLTSWQYHIPSYTNVPQNLRTIKSSLHHTINDITKYINEDLSFHFLDFISYYGVDDLIRILHEGNKMLLQGYNDTLGLAAVIESSNNLYYQPTGTISIPYSNVYDNLGPLGTLWGAGQNPWVVLLNLFGRMYGTEAIGESPDIYQSTFPPQNGPADSQNGNIMDYTFERTTSYVLDNDNTPSVHTDRNYLMKYQWDVIRHALRHFQRVEP